MLLGAEEQAMEILKSVPIPCWILASIVLLSAGLGPVPVAAVHEFTAHRMQHFDLYGVQYGSRSAVVNMEAKGEAANMLNRKCVIVRWKHLTSTKFHSLIDRGAGSILILLPLQNRSMESVEEWESWMTLESELFKLEVPIPVYFALEDSDLLQLYNILSSTAEREKGSSVVALITSALSDYGFQMVTKGEVETKPVKGMAITSMIGTLTGQGMGLNRPTLVLLAHYDAMGLAPSLSYGVDSNASGAAAIIELSRLFSRLYKSSKQRPKYNLVFVLSGGGKFNYFGTKGMLEDLGDSEASSLLSSADYTLCLDSLSATSSNGDLFLHVSKPPKERSQAYQLLQALNQSADLFPGMHLHLVHKKVRLSEDLLAWEHERFSLKRLPAATLSSFQNHKDLRKSSMFMSKLHADTKALARNIQVLAEGITRFIYNVSELDVSVSTPVLGGGGNDVHKDFLEMWVEFLTSHARSPQLLDASHPVVVGLEQALGRYTDDVTTLSHHAEKTDPYFVVYDITSSTMIAYRVKPAVFDLFIALAIGVYGFLWYFSILFFSKIRTVITSCVPLPFSVRAPKTSKND